MGRTVLGDRRGVQPVVLATDEPDLVLAARELSEHVELATGLVPSLSTVPTVGPAILLGTRQDRPDGVDLDPPDHPQGYTIEVTEGRVAVVGGTARGTLYGVYDLLERTGVRWIMPGPYGTVVPSGSLALSTGRWSSEPRFTHRVLQPWSEHTTGSSTVAGYDPREAVVWCRRNRLEGEQFGAHGIPLLPPATPDQEPHLFIQEGRRPTHQIDVTLPEVLDRVEAAVRAQLKAEPDRAVIHLGPEEGGGLGVTVWDVRDRLDPLVGTLVVTDRYIRFFNLLLDRLSDTHPDLLLAFYAHGPCMEPPVREVPNPRLIPVIAPITAEVRMSLRASDHGERDYVLRVIDEWQALGLDWMYRGYLGVFGDPGLPYSPVEELVRTLPIIAERGAGDGIRLECFGGWGHHGLAFHLAGRLMWDPTIDVQAAQKDWLRAAYGPAAPQLDRYLSRLHAAFDSTPFASGGLLDAAGSLPLSVLSDLELHLVQAERALPGDEHHAERARLSVTRRAFSFGNQYLETHRHHLNGAYIEAANSLELTRERIREGQTGSPMAIWHKATSLVEAGVASSIDLVSALVHRYGAPVAVTPRVWEAAIDNSGATARPGVSDGRWTNLDAHLSWTVQGLRHVASAAWYRCQLPGRGVAGAPQLVVAMLTGPCRAWLNGIPVPLLNDLATDRGRDARPARFDLSGAWATDRPNQLLLQVVPDADARVAVGVLGTGMVFVDRTRPWRGPRRQPDHGTEVAPVPSEEVLKPKWLASGAEPVPVNGQWWVLLDPLGVAERLGLNDERVGLDRFRPYDPASSAADQGLGRYGGGMVIRSSLTIPRRAQELLLRGDPATSVWIGQQVCAVRTVPLDATADPAETAQPTWLRVELPQDSARRTGIVIALPRSTPDGRVALDPHWVLTPR